MFKMEPQKVFQFVVSYFFQITYLFLTMVIDIIFQTALHFLMWASLQAIQANQRQTQVCLNYFVVIFVGFYFCPFLKDSAWITNKCNAKD